MKHARHIDRLIAGMQDELDEAREAVRVAFLDFKKYEIAQRIRDEKEQARIKKIEAEIMDEIGLEQYRRSQEETL